MDSEQPHSPCLSFIDPFHLDSKAPVNNDGKAVGRFYWRKRARCMSERTIGIPHEMANDEKKSKRQFFLNVIMADTNH